MDVCTFCAEIENDTQYNLFQKISDDEAFNDRTIFNNDLVRLMPTLGCFISGYTLLVTNDHYDTYSDIEIGKLKKINDLICHIKSVYKKIFGAVTIFEHGCVLKSNRAGACYQHSHLHIVPVDFSYTHKIFANKVEIDSVVELKRYTDPKKSYLYVADFEKQYVIPNPDINSQFMRKQIAEQIGISQYWDWRQYPYLNLMKLTKAELQTQFIQI